jgi:probable HAF family extracellular repeat protein
MKRKHIFILSLFAAVLIAGILITMLNPKGPVLYRVTYLPSLGGKDMVPSSINDRGQIAGYAQVENGDYHLFLWEREKWIQDLGLVSDSCPPRINNAGQISANMEDPNGNKRAFIRDPNHGRFNLPTLGGNKVSAWGGINNQGQIVGEAETASGVIHAFVWDAVNGIRDLTPFSKLTSASRINDAGQVVVADESNLAHPRLVDVNVGLIPESPSIPVYGRNKINNKGFTPGSVMIGPDKYDIGIWNPDSDRIRLLQLNMDSPHADLINDMNQVVIEVNGQSKYTLFGRPSSIPAGKNYLYDPNLGVIPLNDYVDIGSKEHFTIRDINNKGCIIGIIQSGQGTYKRGVLLEPIPERWNK